MTVRLNISKTLSTLIALISVITTSSIQAKDKFETGYLIGADNNKIFYRHSGAGKENIIYVHGGPGFDSTDGGYEFDALAENYHLIAYDQRGAGNSELIDDPNLMTAKHHVEDLEALRKHFKFEKMTLMGMSWGTGLALMYTHHYPHRVDKLVITAPMPLSYPMLTYRYQQVANILSQQDLDTLAKARAQDLSNASDEEIIKNCQTYIPIVFKRYLSPYSKWSNLKGDLCSPNPQGLKRRWSSHEATMDDVGEYNWRELARNVKVPTYITEGALSTIPLSTTNEWAALVPNSKIKYMKKAGHIIWLDDPAQVVKDTTTFMQGQWPEGSYRLDPTHQGLLARYTFENTMVNAQDNWYHPKTKGKTAFTSNRYNRKNAALKLGNKNSAITIEDAKWYVEDKSWTISGWFNVNSSNKGSYSLISQGSLLKMGIKDHKLMLNIGELSITSQESFNYDSWQHIAITRDKDTYKIYNNAKLVAAGCLLDIGKPQGDFVIGNMVGKIDDIRVYTRAKTTGQIAAIYSQLDTK